MAQHGGQNHIKTLEAAISRDLSDLDLEESKIKDRLTQIAKQRVELKDALSWLIAGIPLTQESPTSQISNEPVLSPDAPDGYKSVWTWEKKIKFLLDYSPVALTTSDIVAYIMQFEPNQYERSKVVGSVSSVLSQKSKPGGSFYKGENDRGEYVYINTSLLDA